MTEITFTPGVFQGFIAAKNINLGRLERDLPGGARIEFDGLMLRFDGKDLAYPELRSAIKAGWLQAEGGTISQTLASRTAVVAPVVAPVVPVAAEPTGPKRFEVSQEESLVSTVPRGNKTGVSLPTPKTFNPTIVRDVDGDGRSVGPAKRGPGAQIVADLAGEESGKVVAKIPKAATQTLPSQDGVIVRNFNAPKSGPVLVSDSTSIETAIRKVEDSAVKVLQVGGIIHSASADKLENLFPDAGAGAAAQRAAAAAAERKRQVAASEAKATQEQGATVHNEGEAEDAPAVPELKAYAKPKVPQTVEEVVINGDDVELAPGLRWNKKLHWRTRAKLAVDQYKDRPDVLAIIKAYEQKSVADLIDEHLAKLAAK